jgi:hypothetical protein
MFQSFISYIQFPFIYYVNFQMNQADLKNEENKG